MKDQLKIQEMHNQSGKFGKPVKSIEEKLTGSMRGKSKIPQFIIGDGKKEETQIWIDELVDSLVDEAAEGGVKSLEQSYQAASELEKSRKAWVNLSGGKEEDYKIHFILALLSACWLVSLVIRLS